MKEKQRREKIVKLKKETTVRAKLMQTLKGKPDKAKEFQELSKLNRDQLNELLALQLKGSE